MVRMVVLDQLGRGRSLVNTPSRLAHVVAPLPGLPDQWTPGPAPLVAAGLMVGLVAIACLGNDRGRFALSLLGVEVLVLVLSPSFFSYYDAFAGPGLALVLASIVVWLTALPRRAAIPRVAGIMPGLVATPLALTVIVGLTGSLCADSLVVLSTPFPATSLKHTTSVSRCVTSDSPDALILTDLLSRNHLRGCQVPVDLSGLTYDRDALPLRPDGTSVPRSGNARWQRDLRSYLFSGQSIFVLRAQDDGSTGAAMRDVQALPELRKGRAYALLRNRSFHSRDGGELR
jgi:hypothetical protein